MRTTTHEEALINSYLANNEVTQCKAHYGEHYHLANGKNNTKDTYGEAITTAMEIQVNKDEYGFYECELSEDGSALYCNPVWDRLRTKQLVILQKKVMKLSPDFLDRCDRFKAILKRNARRKANKANRVSKTGKITKYKKRQAPIAPSSLERGV